MCFGLSTTALQRLAFEMAEKNNPDMSSSWKTAKCAGLEWMRGFMLRNKNLSIRKPEGCSLSRLMSFNPLNVKKFFDNMTAVYDSLPQLAVSSRIYNLDETGVTTVHKPKKVIGMKGMKQLNQCTSGERGQLETVVAIVCASGTFVPPVMIFPRKNFKTHMLNEAQSGTLAGWMDDI